MLGLLALGTAGMCAELVALEHYGTSDQLVPLVLGGAGLAVVVWGAVWPGLVVLRVLQCIMLLFVGTGIIGITLHAQTGVEAREQDPAATVPPVLSPGVLVQLGLLGLLYTYKHPALGEEEVSFSSNISNDPATEEGQEIGRAR